MRSLRQFLYEAKSMQRAKTKSAKAKANAIRATRAINSYPSRPASYAGHARAIPGAPFQAPWIPYNAPAQLKPKRQRDNDLELDESDGASSSADDGNHEDSIRADGANRDEAIEIEDDDPYECGDAISTYSLTESDCISQ